MHPKRRPGYNILRSIRSDSNPQIIKPPGVFTEQIRFFRVRSDLEALPLTPNGKVDRGALPASELSRPDLEKTLVAPRTPTQLEIADIWMQVLKVDAVGIHDDFFDLGGHSLLATQVMSRVCEAFRMELPLRSLFEHPTVAGLAVQIAQALAKSVAQEEVTDLLVQLESLSDEEAQQLASGHRRKDYKN